MASCFDLVAHAAVNLFLLSVNPPPLLFLLVSCSTFLRRSKKRPRKDISMSQPVPIQVSDLPEQYEFKDSDKGRVWNEKEAKASKMKIICRSKAMKKTERELPITADRDPGEEDLVGVAAQGFLMNPMSSAIPGWISGYVTLPPRAIKDAEGVGYCSQVFFVAECQPGSFEVAIAMPQDQQIVFEPESAQRYLLSPGDQFFVAPGNVYRLQNHSKKVDCKLFWTIIKVAR
mmetsp:Transcript_46570/g.129863  ORF Transcript_46570/g.129863 Transcript_46570/m.129863 type:complete len:230 (-) Transcript_46570:177-866(-)